MVSSADVRGRRCARWLARVTGSAAFALMLQLNAMDPACAADSKRIGISPDWMDPAVSPRADLFQAANGRWLATHPIPADRSTYGIDAYTQEQTLLQLRALVEELTARTDLAPGSDDARLADLYRDFMDEAGADRLGLQPVQPLLAIVDQLQSRTQLGSVFGQVAAAGVQVPVELDTVADERQSSRYAVHLSQAGLSLPDRDYYLLNDARLRGIRKQFLPYAAALLVRGGVAVAQSDAAARQVLAFETRLAALQWSRVRNRDPLRVYNPRSLVALQRMAPHLDWPTLLGAQFVPTDPGTLIVAQPDFIVGLDRLLAHTPLSVIRNALRVQVLRSAAPWLDADTVALSYAFEAGVLRGVPQQQPRWKRGLNLLEATYGEALGRLYVERHFPPQAKAGVQAVVDHLITAYADSIAQLDWLAPATRTEALSKLRQIRPKLGYPVRWRDYSACQVKPGDLFGNVQRAGRCDMQRRNARLREPVDRDEWQMTPQTVNAYYEPTLNEIVFPAAQLQVPYFDVAADDAANYGNIGFVIGHELSHAFDDQGSQFDGQGNLRDWWTPADHRQFVTRTAALVAQYDALIPLPGSHVNGQLTLGENIADNVGLTIAWKAWQASLQGHEAPVIDGLTGAQRFFISYAQSWLGEVREEEERQRLKTDPHAPLAVRTNQTVRNQDAFYEAFGVQPGDPMWLPPAQRVHLW